MELLGALQQTRRTSSALSLTQAAAAAAAATATATAATAAAAEPAAEATHVVSRCAVGLVCLFFLSLLLFIQ